VLDFFQLEDNIAGLLVGELVCFTSEDDLLSFSCTAGNVKLEDVLRFDDFLAFALFATVLLGNDLPGSLAVAAGDGLLCDEAGTDLAEDSFRAWIMSTLSYEGGAVVTYLARCTGCTRCS
jgi:hypothetical protein